MEPKPTRQDYHTKYYQEKKAELNDRRLRCYYKNTYGIPYELTDHFIANRPAYKILLKHKEELNHDLVKHILSIE